MQYGTGHDSSGSEPWFCKFGNWGMVFRTVLWTAALMHIRKAPCARLLVISGIVLVAVQNPGSVFSLDRLRRCWNGTSFRPILIHVASAILGGWTDDLMQSCVRWMLPLVLS